MLKWLTDTGRRAGIVWPLAIVVLSASGGVLLDRLAPGVTRYSRDWLIQARGSLPVPDDIAIIAIDEASIARFGRFPWSRSVMARSIGAIEAAHPRAIAADVLFADPTSPDEDNGLAKAIAQGGNVIVAAQLISSPSGGEAAVWLQPLPAIARAAAAVGHVNVLTESEGVARAILFQASDDTGLTFRGMPFETIRIGEGTPEKTVLEGRNEVQLGARSIPTEVSTPPVVMASERGDSQILRAHRMNIDYIGPAGSFAPATYSVADLLDGRVPASRLAGRYVLIGATAASLGDRLSSPFIHQPDLRGGDQHGLPMPGVEVLANAMNTILRSRFYAETPDWIAFLWAALVAAVTLGLLTLAQGRWESLKQVAALTGVAAAVVLISYLAFTRFLVFPPLAPGTVSFACAGMLGLLRRSLATSATLDAGLAQLALSGESLGPTADPQAAAESITRLTETAGAAVFALESPGEYRLVASHGVPLVRGPGGAIRIASDRESRFLIESEVLSGPPGLLALAVSPERPVPGEALRLACAIASSCVQTATAPLPPENWWAEGLESKARRLGGLNAQLLERTRFVEQALSSVEDGLIVTGPDGCILFANRIAAEILGSASDALVGRNLLRQLAEKAKPAPDEHAVLASLLLDRARLEFEIAIGENNTRRYNLRLSAVQAQKDDSGPLLGLVASLSDTTRQHELQQTKNDVIALVSHEMRTPLTAIQGMTELLADYDVERERSREMHRAINAEVKRLTGMITEYLDITRLEAGATGLRVSPVRLEALVERSLLMLEPLAAVRQIRLIRNLAPVEPLLADPALVSRAVDNLISNAIKYSPGGTEVTISIHGESGAVVIEVADQGYGIPPEHMDRVFQKFYRVPRVQDADVTGTGLGLAFVREIAGLHGGSVTVRSEVNQGSRFALRLPVTPDSSGAIGEPGID